MAEAVSYRFASYPYHTTPRHTIPTNAAIKPEVKERKMCLPKKDHSSLFNCLNRMEDNGRRRSRYNSSSKSTSNNQQQQNMRNENNEWN